MTQVCPVCDPPRFFDDAAQLCNVCISTLERHVPQADIAADAAGEQDPVDPQPPAAAAPMWQCWNCGTPPHPGNTECVDCHRSLTPPALVIRFRDGTVEIDRGSQVELGRHGRYARLFRSFGNVSRRHAVVGVDVDGRAWIEPNPTPNGTFVNQREIAPSVRRPLESHQVVRFARFAEGVVMVYPSSGATA